MIYELMIIGGGPAGLCAAVYAARKQLKTILVAADVGGQVNWTKGVENYLGYQLIEGQELIDRFHAQVSQFPIDQKIGEKVNKLEWNDNGFTAVSESGARYQSMSVVLASGKKPRKLNVPGEDEFLGRGVTYCAVCDGPLFFGKRVAVVGGGNSALEAVLDVARVAEHIDLISMTPLTADQILVERASALKNLTTYVEYQTEKIEGKDFVDGIIIRNMKTGVHKKLDVAGVFVEIGLTPNSDMVAALLNLNKSGEVPVSCFCETTVSGLFAAGDVTDVPDKQIIIAAGEGAKAALQAHRYLQRLEK
ncbi:MAG: FAD-dependent oxidoreductase [Dehalococcoidales bacterium]|nr:FAD-dependent oxidoreductase [Dehalococcoidales bacterium]